MKYILLFLFLLSNLFAREIDLTILHVDNQKHRAIVQAPTQLQKGISGFGIHFIAKNHTSILANVVVKEYFENNKTALIELKAFNTLENNALPKGEWKLQKGDIIVLAVGYSRALLIAPSEEIYHKITSRIKVQWVHPDLYATVLSFSGHPTPLKSDFDAMLDATGTGLLFIYLNQKLFTLDMKTFKILAINDAPFHQKKTQLPFYSRIKKIEAAWFGEGSDEMESYAPHYYDLLVTYNPENQSLYKIIKQQKLLKILQKFTIGDAK
jgi:hypothetical protein